MDNNYRMTVSRDRLAEFRRNSAILTAANGNQQQCQQQQKRRASTDHHNVATCCNEHTTAYQPSIHPQSSYASKIQCEKYSNRQCVLPLMVIRNNDLSTTEAFFLKVEEIKRMVAETNENVSEIESLRSSSLFSINGDHSGQVNYHLENLVHQTSKLNKEIRNCIREIELSNANLTLNPNDRQMRGTQLQTLKKKFVETIQRYQDIERTHEKKQRQRIERQILIVKPEATPHEIEMAIDSNDAPQIFAHSLLNLSRTGNASQVLNEVQTRHKDIKKIERTILELHQLFLDMQQMVELQHETIINIEKSSENTNYELEQGIRHVDVAVTTSKTTRKRRWCCFIIFIILLVFAGILIWRFAFPKSISLFTNN